VYRGLVAIVSTGDKVGIWYEVSCRVGDDEESRHVSRSGSSEL